MATFKKSEIRAIAARTPAELVGKQITDFLSTPVGYFRPASCNWAYQVFAIATGKVAILVVSVFGEIRGKV